MSDNGLELLNNIKTMKSLLISKLWLMGHQKTEANKNLLLKRAKHYLVNVNFDCTAFG